MPTSRLDTGFRAAARIANPSGVKRKKRNTRIKTANVTAIIPTSCDDIYLLPYLAPDGNGLGKLLIVQLEIYPARLLRMSSSPMNTITIFSTGRHSTGRMMICSMATSAANEETRVRPKAAQ